MIIHPSHHENRRIIFVIPKIEAIKWPGKAGGLIQDGHDRELMSSWLPPE